MVGTSRCPDHIMRQAYGLLDSWHDVDSIAEGVAEVGKGGSLAGLAELRGRQVRAELIRGENIRAGRMPLAQTRIRQRYYHPTKGWRLPRRLRRDLKANGVVLA